MSCKNCTERRINCHAVCEKYIKWKAEDDKRKEEIRKKRDELVNITGYEKQRHINMKTRRKVSVDRI
jgi:hypothetical protein